MRIVVVIPAYNEARSIHRVVRAIPRVIDSVHELAVVVVDDGSTDETAELAAAAGADLVHSHGTNQGVGASFATGIRLALQLGADVVVTMDADGQSNPKEIPRMLGPILERAAHATLGTRFNHEYKNQSTPLGNLISNGLMALLLSILLMRRFTDVTSGFRAFHARTISSLEIEKTWNTHSFLFDLVTAGFRVVEVPVSVRYFKGRKSRVIHSLTSYAFSSASGILRRFVPSLRKREL